MWVFTSSIRSLDVRAVFDVYSSGSNYLSTSNLLRFLRDTQRETTVTKEQAKALVDQFERETTARQNRRMSFIGFLRYMESNHGSIFNQAHTRVYQYMDYPLTSYFISSSHNTYMSGDRPVTGLDAYVIPLKKGCRCLDINCWDGANQKPVVHDGVDLTRKVLFRDVIHTIEEHAFEVSAYPVILSLQNHCSKEQQEVMAQYLISILGDKLLRAPLDDLTTGEMPSPDELKYKILVMTKKQRKSKDATRIDVQDSAEEEKAEDEDDDDEEEEEAPWWAFWSQRPAQKSQKVKTKKIVAEALADLVIYTCSVKFVSFSHSSDNQNCYENTSLSEKKASKLVKNAAKDFVKHSQRFLNRIYPTTSSNYDPQNFWNAGAQLVALNFQSWGSAMDLNDGRFMDNGGCGYILKPDILMSTERFNPRAFIHKNLQTVMHLKVISAANLPLSGRSTLNPFIQVKTHGVWCDCHEKTTYTIYNNHWGPHWKQELPFVINVPQLCLIRFCVRNQIDLFTSELVAQYSLPVLSMMKGYRWVPLRAQDGSTLDQASLFVHVHLSNGY